MEVKEEEEVLPWSLGHRVSRCWVLGSPNPEMDGGVCDPSDLQAGQRTPSVPELGIQ